MDPFSAINTSTVWNIIVLQFMFITAALGLSLFTVLSSWSSVKLSSVGVSR